MVGYAPTALYCIESRGKLMNNIQIFNNPEFGEIRTVTINEKEYFYGVDVANALLYKRPSKAVTDNCKGILNQDTIKNAGGYPELLIPEGDVYRLIIKAGQQGNSKEIKEKADKFEKWIFDEVLPEIRRTGTYGQKRLPMTIPEQIQIIAQGYGELHEEVQTIKKDLEDFKNDMPILGVEESKITNAVKRKGVECLGGKESNAYNDRSVRGRLYSDLHNQLRREFGVSTYKAIKRNQADTAVSIIQCYVPPLVLSETIDTLNAQQTLNV
ncbi:hypothetical protein D3Z60_02320 [Lachnospiraceae bacterium]|jgi:prophage antirepressor-like protein|nr:hypothetical protein [Lachnospiraceae bacterium]